jgi:DNA polymerase V
MKTFDADALPPGVWLSQADKPAPRPLFESVAAGFPSPAEDYMDTRLDLNTYCIHRPASTYFMRVQGDSMKQAGIYDGDLLVVDRSVAPRYDDIVVAVVDGEFTVKKLCRRNGVVFLAPANPDFDPIVISEADDFRIWGVAVHVVHRLKTL